MAARGRWSRRSAFLIGLGGLLGGAGAVYVSQHIIHQPWSHKSRTKELIDLSKRRRATTLLQGIFTNPGEAFGLKFSCVEFKNERGEELRGWCIPPQKVPRDGDTEGASKKENAKELTIRKGSQSSSDNDPVYVVTVHGSGNDRRDWLRHVPMLLHTGVGVLMFDCSSHGVSEGHRGASLGANEHQDVIAACKFARENLGAQKCVVMGTSQGAAASLLAAAKAPELMDGVVLENPASRSEEAILYNIRTVLHGGNDALATSARLQKDFLTRSMLQFRSYVPDWFVRLSARVAWLRMGLWGCPEPIEASQHLREIPLLLIHGTNDEMIPYSHSSELYKCAAPTQKQLWTPSGRHMAIYNQHPEDYEQRVKDLLESVRYGVVYSARCCDAASQRRFGTPEKGEGGLE